MKLKTNKFWKTTGGQDRIEYDRYKINFIKLCINYNQYRIYNHINCFIKL